MKVGEIWESLFSTMKLEIVELCEYNGRPACKIKVIESESLDGYETTFLQNVLHNRWTLIKSSVPDWRI